MAALVRGSGVNFKHEVSHIMFAVMRKVCLHTMFAVWANELKICLPKA